MVKLKFILLCSLFSCPFACAMNRGSAALNILQRFTAKNNVNPYRSFWTRSTYKKANITPPKKPVGDDKSAVCKSDEDRALMMTLFLLNQSNLYSSQGLSDSHKDKSNNWHSQDSSSSAYSAPDSYSAESTSSYSAPDSYSSDSTSSGSSCNS